ncbi:MAG: flagellar biosynthetic protein FliR [Bdellovibrionales bacterium]|nr:flagellar biosynthetic protein FliR [Bdellovibrionales bacterium]
MDEVTVFSVVPNALWSWCALTLRVFTALVIIPAVRGAMPVSTLGAVSVLLGLQFSRIGCIQPVACGTMASQTSEEALCELLLSLVCGVLVGLPSAVAGEFLTTALEVGDASRGARSGEQLNPLLGVTHSPITQAASLGLLIAATSMGFHHIIFEALLLPYSAESAAGFVPRAMTLALVSFRVGVVVAAPVIVVGLLIDIGGAMVSTSLPRVQLHYELLPVKMVLGLVVGVWVLCQLDRVPLVERFVQHTAAVSMGMAGGG